MSSSRRVADLAKTQCVERLVSRRGWRDPCWRKVLPEKQWVLEESVK